MNKLSTIRRQTLTVITAIIGALLVSSCTPSRDDTHNRPTQSSGESKTMSESNIAVLTTSYGEIKVELDAEKAPLTVANFKQYAADGHYDGTIFHRVISNFMIQGGGFEIGMNQKKTNAPIANEANNGLTNDKYTIAMARTPDPHSATSQFFINTKDNDFLNFTSESPSGWGYAVFGKVIDGFAVVDQIEGAATGNVGPHGDVPQTDIVIVSVAFE